MKYKDTEPVYAYSSETKCDLFYSGMPLGLLYDHPRLIDVDIQVEKVLFPVELGLFAVFQVLEMKVFIVPGSKCIHIALDFIKNDQFRYFMEFDFVFERFQDTTNDTHTTRAAVFKCVDDSTLGVLATYLFNSCGQVIDPEYLDVLALDAAHSVVLYWHSQF